MTARPVAAARRATGAIPRNWDNPLALFDHHEPAADAEALGGAALFIRSTALFADAVMPHQPTRSEVPS